VPWQGALFALVVEFPMFGTSSYRYTLRFKPPLEFADFHTCLSVVAMAQL
jgi:hypothetical protein